MRVSRRGIGLICVSGGKFTLHLFGIHADSRLWGYSQEYLYYDGPIRGFGLGWFALLVWSEAWS